MSDQLVIPDMPVPQIEPARDIIPSTFTSQHEMLYAIQQLYGPIYADMTYSTGQFWEGMSVKPVIRADIQPMYDVIGADFTKMPFPSRSIPSMIIDPPFLMDRGKKEEYAEDSLQMTKRFSAYEDVGDLMSSYAAAFYESYRVLKTGGYLAFKCQDIISRGRYFAASCFAWQMAMNAGFFVEDKFILIASSRIIGGRWERQLHSRRYDSTVFIFRKPKGKYSGIQGSED